MASPRVLATLWLYLFPTSCRVQSRPFYSASAQGTSPHLLVLLAYQARASQWSITHRLKMATWYSCPGQLVFSQAQSSRLPVRTVTGSCSSPCACRQSSSQLPLLPLPRSKLPGHVDTHGENTVSSARPAFSATQICCEQNTMQ